jgi:hypothetical protein
MLLQQRGTTTSIENSTLTLGKAMNSSRYSLGPMTDQKGGRTTSQTSYRMDGKQRLDDVDGQIRNEQHDGDT